MSRSIKKRTQQNTFQNQSVVNDLFSPQPPQILDDSQQLNPNQEEDDNENELNEEDDNENELNEEDDENELNEEDDEG